MHTPTHACTYIRTHVYVHADTDKDVHTPTQTYINVGYATAAVDTLMIRPILIDPKVSILHMYNFSMFLQVRTISVTKVTLIDQIWNALNLTVTRGKCIWPTFREHICIRGIIPEIT